MICDRCGRETLSSTGSMFNMEQICLDECLPREQAHPSYKRAVDTERAQVARGNFNFGGIGLPFDLGGPDDDQTTTRGRSS